MIARVRAVSFRRASTGSMPHVCGSESTSTGIAPVKRTTLAVEMKVRSGTRTSSPGPIPSVARQR